MPKYKIGGLSKSKGVAAMEFKPYPAGDYIFSLTDVKEQESESGLGINFTFKFQILEGPEDADGKSTSGRPFTTNCFVMGEDHPSYEEWRHIGIDWIKSLCDAADVQIKSDGFDTESVIGAEVGGKMRIKNELNKKTGEYSMRNSITAFFKPA